MPNKLRIFTKGILPVVIPVAVLFAAILFLFELLDRLDANFDRQVGYCEILSQEWSLARQFHTAGCTLGFYRITKAEAFSKQYRIAHDSIQKSVKEIQEPSATTSEQRALISQIREISASGLASVKSAMQVIDADMKSKPFQSYSSDKYQDREAQLNQSYTNITEKAADLQRMADELVDNDGYRDSGLVLAKSDASLRKSAFVAVIVSFLLSGVFLGALTLHIGKLDSSNHRSKLNTFLLCIVPTLLPLFVLIWPITILLTSIDQTQMHIKHQLQKQAIICQSNLISKLLYDSGLYVAGYCITGSEVFVASYKMVKDKFPNEISKLRTLVVEYPVQLERLESIARIADEQFSVLDESVDIVRKNDIEKAKQTRTPSYYKAMRSRADAAADGLQAIQNNSTPSWIDSEERKKSRFERKSFVLLSVSGALLFALVFLFNLSKSATKNIEQV